jgi:hypothetical protein
MKLLKDATKLMQGSHNENCNVTLTIQIIILEISRVKLQYHKNSLKGQITCSYDGDPSVPFACYCIIGNK